MQWLYIYIYKFSYILICESHMYFIAVGRYVYIKTKKTVVSLAMGSFDADITILGN